MFLPQFCHAQDARIRWLEGEGYMKRKFVHAILLGLMFTSLSAAADENSNQGQSANLAGSWQISWEARIGTETGTINLRQDGAQLMGEYSGPAGTAAASGTVEGKNVLLKLEFPGKYSYVLEFSGLAESEKMSGKFAVGRMKDGYDSHGENARPTDYSWKATRMAAKSSAANAGRK